MHYLDSPSGVYASVAITEGNEMIRPKTVIDGCHRQNLNPPSEYLHLSVVLIVPRECFSVILEALDVRKYGKPYEMTTYQIKRLSYETSTDYTFFYPRSLSYGTSAQC